VDVRYWQDRWARGEIGFHRAEVNPLLPRHWPGLRVRPGSRVLVPLCGKSLDMRWLAAQGHPVLGVEASEVAVREFFAEAGVTPARRAVGRYEVWSAAGIEIACGDFFHLADLDLSDVGACYDRAALIALPPELRRRYAGLLCGSLPGDACGLLVTLAYDQSVVPGPPFSVEDAEVHELFGPRFFIDLRSRDDVLAELPRMAQVGVKRAEQSAFALVDREP
jgi:thiopurine S-methyltransferase